MNREGIKKLLWSVRLSVRYNNHRWQFFDFLHTFFMFFISLLGSLTCVSILIQDIDFYTLCSGFLIIFFLTLDLVISTTKKASLHSDISKKFINLEKEIIIVGDNPTNSDLKKLRLTRLNIESEEPPVLHVLWDFCYNEMLQLEGNEEGKILKFKWYHKVTKNFTDIGFHKIKIDINWKSNNSV